MLCINDIPQTLSDSLTYLYVEDTSIFYQHKSVAEIKSFLHKDFANVCEWFVANKLETSFGKDKSKCILFSKEKTCRS